MTKYLAVVAIFREANSIERFSVLLDRFSPRNFDLLNGDGIRWASITKKQQKKKFSLRNSLIQSRFS